MGNRIQNVLVLGDDRLPRHRKLMRFLYEAGDRIGVRVVTRDVSGIWDGLESLKEESEEERRLLRLGIVEQIGKMIYGFEIDHVIALDAADLLVPEILLIEEKPLKIHHLWLHPLKMLLRFWQWEELKLGSWSPLLGHEKCRHYYLQDTLQLLPGMTWSFLCPGAPRSFLDRTQAPKKMTKIACELDLSYLPVFDPECLERLKSNLSKAHFMAYYEKLPYHEQIPYQNLWYLYKGREDIDIFGACGELENYGLSAFPELDPYEKHKTLTDYRAHLHLMSPLLIGVPYERIPESMAMGSVPILLSPDLYVGPWQGVIVINDDEHWSTVREDFKTHREDWHRIALKDQERVENEGLWEHRLQALLDK